MAWITSCWPLATRLLACVRRSKRWRSRSRCWKEKSVGGDGPGAPSRRRTGQDRSAVRACTVLELDERRGRRWRSRPDSFDDGVPGRAVHGLLPVEIEAIVELFVRFGDIDRSYRKLAPRGSYEGLVWVSEATVYRTLAAHGLVLPAPPPRSPTPAPPPIPDWAEWRPNQIWIYDMTHFAAAKRVAFAVMDVVSRRWLRTLVTTEESATQVEVLFTGALDDEGIWERIEARHAGSPLDGDNPEVPILLAMS